MSLRQLGIRLLLLLVPVAAPAQQIEQHRAMAVNMPEDGPLAVLRADWGDSKTVAQGGAVVLDLHASLVLRNTDRRRIRGVTLEVAAQQLTPGGKTSVSVPSLNVGPGETFPLRIDVRLLRPLLTSQDPLVQIHLDDVLFDTLATYGPNKLNLRRTMLTWEVEARRDRKYFKSLLEARGQDALAGEFRDSLARLADHAKSDAQMARVGRATTRDAEREMQVAFLEFPNAPVEPITGFARVARNEVRTPQLSLRNRSDRAVKTVEIGWLIRDDHGQEYLAGILPAELKLAPGQEASLLPQQSLKFSLRNGQPLWIDGMTGYVSNVEFSDGSIWVPNRGPAGDSRLRRLMVPSPEEQRLAELYQKRGLGAVVEELRRF